MLFSVRYKSIFQGNWLKEIPIILFLNVPLRISIFKASLQLYNHCRSNLYQNCHSPDFRMQLHAQLSTAYFERYAISTRSWKICSAIVFRNVLSCNSGMETNSIVKLCPAIELSGEKQLRFESVIIKNVSKWFWHPATYVTPSQIEIITKNLLIRRPRMSIFLSDDLWFERASIYWGARVFVAQ